MCFFPSPEWELARPGSPRQLGTCQEGDRAEVTGKGGVADKGKERLAELQIRGFGEQTGTPWGWWGRGPAQGHAPEEGPWWNE